MGLAAAAPQAAAAWRWTVLAGDSVQASRADLSTREATCHPQKHPHSAAVDHHACTVARLAEPVCVHPARCDDKVHGRRAMATAGGNAARGRFKQSATEYARPWSVSVSSRLSLCHQIDGAGGDRLSDPMRVVSRSATSARTRRTESVILPTPRSSAQSAVGSARGYAAVLGLHAVGHVFKL